MSEEITISTAVSGGQVTLTMPKNLTKDDISDLEEWLRYVDWKIQRTKNQPPATKEE